MKAAVITDIGKVEVREVPKPSIEGGGLLLRVEACAICGTDVRIFNFGHSKVKFPWTTGHEFAGVVEDIKGLPDVDLKVGDRVNVDPTDGCGKCEYCKAGRASLCPETKAIGYYYPGAFAQYIAIPPSIVRAGGVYKIPDDLSFPEAAVTEPVAAAINGHENLHIKLGETVAIIGAGPLGYIHSIISKLEGAAKVIIMDVVDDRLKFASEFGVNLAFNSSKVDPVEAVREATGGAGADVAIVACSVTQVIEQAMKMVKKRGRVLLFAGFPKDRSRVEMDVNLIHYSEIGVFGSFGAPRAAYDTAHKLVASGVFPAKKFVSATLPLDRIAEGFAMAKAGQGLRIVMQPWA
ncbi:MAG: alcohol dehydrogenase catalytic domain-containing protein [Firmicutes bacterium]|nr:alcohol dehydrogenase catalytic domain-containing protein [Bacillota bacterium]